MPDTVYTEATKETEDVRVEERQALEYFMSCKSRYEIQRVPWETKWRQAAASVYGTGNLDKVYEGRSKIQSPIMFWKSRAIWSRVSQTILKRTPYGRLEDKNLRKQNKNYVDIVSKYMFEHQLENIGFKPAFKLATQEKAVFGTYVAKIPQKYEVEEFSYDPDEEAEEIVVKDDPYFELLRIHEFYSDVYQQDINDSDACIHATTTSMAELNKNKLEKKKDLFELKDEESGEVIGYEEGEEYEVGKYKNLDLLEGLDDASNLSEGQREYLEMMGVNVTDAEASREVKAFKKEIKTAHTSGFVSIDECYGKWYFDGVEKEAVCTIAAGKVIIQGPEPVKTRHKKYKRPFLIGRYITIPNSLYGICPNIMGQNLLQELNASRAQNNDAKTQSIFPMWYQDVNKKVAWNKQWKPNGIIKGMGPKGIEPILNPYLGNIAIDDASVISKDIDQLFGVASIQDGSSDRGNMPDTAGQTAMVISQNDIPLNDLIDDTLENEIKPFFQMVYERNLTFKTMSDFLVVWSNEDLEKAGFVAEESEDSDDIVLKTIGGEGGEQKEVEMKDLVFDVNVTILGPREISNERAQQAGWAAFSADRREDPSLAKRTNPKKVYKHKLASYGIFDETEDIWVDEEAVKEITQEDNEARAAAEEKAKKDDITNYQNKKAVDVQAHEVEKQIDTEANMAERTHEVVIEKLTGEKTA